jgi:hypothetical protein
MKAWALTNGNLRRGSLPQKVEEGSNGINVGSCRLPGCRDQIWLDQDPLHFVQADIILDEVQGFAYILVAIIALC